MFFVSLFFVLIFVVVLAKRKHENIKWKETQAKKKNEMKREQAWRASRSVATPTNQSFGVCKVNLADPEGRNYSLFAVYYLISNVTVQFVVSRVMRRASRRSNARFRDWSGQVINCPR